MQCMLPVLSVHPVLSVASVHHPVLSGIIISVHVAVVHRARGSMLPFLDRHISAPCGISSEVAVHVLSVASAAVHPVLRIMEHLQFGSRLSNN